VILDPHKHDVCRKTPVGVQGTRSDWYVSQIVHNAVVAGKFARAFMLHYVFVECCPGTQNYSYIILQLRSLQAVLMLLGLRELSSYSSMASCTSCTIPDQLAVSAEKYVSKTSLSTLSPICMCPPFVVLKCNPPFSSSFFSPIQSSL
jgi:hypothetical protein